jgi:putative hydrolase of the HAD superfamily
MPARNGPQTLLIDADDTLWENNVYFERAIASFISFINHQHYTPAEVRGILNEVERECIVKHGYGLHSFQHALEDTFVHLSKEPITPQLLKTIHSFASHIVEHPIEMFAEVPETLAYLTDRHKLILLTKGNITEQSGKVERSGLKEYFAAVEIVAEKDAHTYGEIVNKYALTRQHTWMVGNSPKSDINPALEAGLNAVYVPHEMTWVLEKCDLAEGVHSGELLTVKSFADLRNHF